MSERPVKIHFPLPDSPLKNGNEVPITESTERWTEVILEDGTTLRVKPTVISAVRVENEYDPEGNPAYAIKVAPAMTVIAPDHLKRGATKAAIQ